MILNKILINLISFKYCFKFIKKLGKQGLWTEKTLSGDSLLKECIFQEKPHPYLNITLFEILLRYLEPNPVEKNGNLLLTAVIKNPKNRLKFLRKMIDSKHVKTFNFTNLYKHNFFNFFFR